MIKINFAKLISKNKELILSETKVRVHDEEFKVDIETIDNNLDDNQITELNEYYKEKKKELRKEKERKEMEEKRRREDEKIKR